MSENKMKKNDLYRILPFNERVDKMFEDKLTLYYVLSDHRENLCNYYAVVVTRNGEKNIINLEASHGKDIVSILDEKKELSIIPSDNSKDFFHVLKKNGDSYFIDNEKIDINLLPTYLKVDSLILDKVYIENSNKKYVTIVKGDNREARVVDFSKDISDDILNKVIEISNSFPEVDYMNFNIILNDVGFKIYNIETGEDLLSRSNFSNELSVFLEDKVNSFRKESVKLRIKNLIKKYFDLYANKSGWEGYMYRNWIIGLVDDYKYKGTTIKEKRWSHRKGFYSYRLEQYHISDNNYNEYLSDRDYKWLRQINCKYRKWLRDKIQFYYVLKNYENFLPTYYCHIVGGTIMGFNDLPNRMSVDNV